MNCCFFYLSFCNITTYHLSFPFQSPLFAHVLCKKTLKVLFHVHLLSSFCRKQVCFSNDLWNLVLLICLATGLETNYFSRIPRKKTRNNLKLWNRFRLLIISGCSQNSCSSDFDLKIWRVDPWRRPVLGFHYCHNFIPCWVGSCMSFLPLDCPSCLADGVHSWEFYKCHFFVYYFSAMVVSSPLHLFKTDFSNT